MLVFLAARFVRFGEADPSLWTALNLDLRFGLVLYAVAWVTTLWFLGLYAFRVRWVIASEFNDILVATFIVAFAILSFLYLVKVDVSRLFLLLLLIFQPLATMAERLVVRLGFNRLRTRGHNRCFMVVIGTGDEAQAFADAVERHKQLGIEVEDGPGGGRGLTPTRVAFPQPTVGEEVGAVSAASGAAEAISPAGLDEVAQTRLVVREAPIELRQGARIVAGIVSAHPAGHYMLCGPDPRG